MATTESGFCLGKTKIKPAHPIFQINIKILKR